VVVSRRIKRGGIGGRDGGEAGRKDHMRGKETVVGRWKDGDEETVERSRVEREREDRASSRVKGEPGSAGELFRRTMSHNWEKEGRRTGYLEAPGSHRSRRA
jgi:hypothetical protein